MMTYHVRCHVCGRDKWPTLAARPEQYTCALCRAEDGFEGPTRRQAGQRGAQAKKSQQRSPGEAT